LRLLFEDNFDDFDLETWEHEVTMGGDGNNEFQTYINNRSISWTEDGLLFIKPQLFSDIIGEQNVKVGGYVYSLWDECTGNQWDGCSRVSGNAGKYLNPISSARIRTLNSFSFKYGKLEIKAKLPRGDWLWPSVKLYPTHNTYGPWPASGSMTVLQSRGNPPSDTQNMEGFNSFSSALQWGPLRHENQYTTVQSVFSSAETTNLTGDWHVYTLEWDSKSISTFIDGTLVLNVNTESQSFWNKEPLWEQNKNSNPWSGKANNAPFDQDFYISIGLAVGGSSGYFPDGAPGKPWINNDKFSVNGFYDTIGQWIPSWGLGDQSYPSSLKIDYVKVWCDESKGSCHADGGSPPISPNVPLPPSPPQPPFPAGLGLGLLFLRYPSFLDAFPSEQRVIGYLASAGGVSHIGTPFRSTEFGLNDIIATYTVGEKTKFQISVDGPVAGTAVQVKVKYDFNGDHILTRMEVYEYFTLDEGTGWQSYTEASGLQTVSGCEFQDFRKGSVNVEIWSALGNKAVLIYLDVPSTDPNSSFLKIPYGDGFYSSNVGSQVEPQNVVVVENPAESSMDAEIAMAVAIVLAVLVCIAAAIGLVAAYRSNKKNVIAAEKSKKEDTLELKEVQTKL
jgi:beta-glucanase (GH16 family)